MSEKKQPVIQVWPASLRELAETTEARLWGGPARYGRARPVDRYQPRTA